MACSFHRAVAVLVGGWAVVWSAGALAGTCPVHVSPESAPDAWREAARKAAARLAKDSAPGDCRAVEVAVTPDGAAKLTFVTLDGREATRSLDTPADLRPTLEALLVTLPPPRPSRAGTDASEQGTSPQASSTQGASEQGTSGQGASPQASSTQGTSGQGTSRPSPSPRGTSERAAPRPDPSRDEAAGGLHLVAGGSAGARFAGSSAAFLSPAFALHAGVITGRWELGLAGASAPIFALLGDTAPDRFALWSLSAELTVGRRDPVRRLVLGYGLSISVQWLEESATTLPGGAAHRTISSANPRMGLYGKALYPLRPRVHFTAGLAGDAVLSHLPDKSARNKELPLLPRFGAEVTFGLEIVLL